MVDETEREEPNLSNHGPGNTVRPVRQTFVEKATNLGPGPVPARVAVVVNPVSFELADWLVDDPSCEADDGAPANPMPLLKTFAQTCEHRANVGGFQSNELKGGLGEAHRMLRDCLRERSPQAFWRRRCPFASWRPFAEK